MSIGLLIEIGLKSVLCAALTLLALALLRRRSAGERARLVDRRHRAAAEPLEQLEAADGAADQRVLRIGLARHLEGVGALRAGQRARIRPECRGEGMLAVWAADADGHGPMLGDRAGKSTPAEMARTEVTGAQPVTVQRSRRTARGPR